MRKKSVGRSKERAVKYEKQLSFLNEKFSFVPRKRNYANAQSDPLANRKSDEPQVKILNVENKLKATEPYKTEKKNTEDKAVHELNAFFEGIAETVKTFPKKIQVQLKRDIFNLVNDTEASLVNDNGANIMYYTIGSPMVGGPEYVGNQIMDLPSVNQYNANPLNLLQNTDDATNICQIQIKEENII